MAHICASYTQKYYIVYLARKVGLFRPSVEFAVRVVGELARAEGEYCKHTRSEGRQSPRCIPYLV